MAGPSGGASGRGAPTELAGAIGPVPPATELAFAAPSAGPGASPPAGPQAGAAHPPVGTGQAPAATPAYEATITEAAVGGTGSGPGAGAGSGGHVPAATRADRYGGGGAYSPPSGYGQSGYGQSGYGQGGYGQGGYGAPGPTDQRPTDQRWGGSGYQQPSYQGPPPRRRGKALPILLGILVSPFWAEPRRSCCTCAAAAVRTAGRPAR